MKFPERKIAMLPFLRMPIVYRYTDLNDNIVKYIGIITRENRSLDKRLMEHKVKNAWAYGNYKIDYFEVQSRTDAEAYEAHLIAYYDTYKYFNKAKANWGLSTYLPTTIIWKPYVTYYGDFKMNKQRINEYPDSICRYKKICTNLDKPHKIFQCNGFWCIQISDNNKSTGRRLVKRKEKRKLIEYLNGFNIQYYEKSS